MLEMSSNIYQYAGIILVALGTLSMWYSNKKSSKEDLDEQTINIIEAVKGANGKEREEIIDAMGLTGKEIVGVVNASHADTREIVLDGLGKFREETQKTQEGIKDELTTTNIRMDGISDFVENVAKKQNDFDFKNAVLDMVIYFRFINGTPIEEQNMPEPPELFYISFTQGDIVQDYQVNSEIPFSTVHVSDFGSEVSNRNKEELHFIDVIEKRIILHRTTLEEPSKNGEIDVSKPFGFFIHSRIIVPSTVRKIEVGEADFTYNGVKMSLGDFSYPNDKRYQAPYRYSEEIETRILVKGTIKSK